MVNKPELLVTAGSLNEISTLIDAGADALLIGNDRFGMRLAGSFSIEEIQEAVQQAHARQVHVYVSLQNLMSNDLLDSLPDYVKALGNAGVDGVEFNDPSVLMAVKTYAPQMKLHWNAEMTTTNYATANYWGRRGAKRVVFARELNMDEITGMKGHLEIESQVQVHGMTNIYHSKRSLVGSYMLHQGRPLDGGSLGKERGLFLLEGERPGEKYPIYEDINGTHIMSSDDICILEDLHFLLEAGVNSLKVEGLLKPLSYNETVVRTYRQVIDTYMADPANYSYQEQFMDNIRKIQDPERELTFGFFYKEQVY
ncbi:peptidase U32 family protein [Paenibacillus macquariensis]|uniref:Protease n=1 Tax=Paenibacillus macquariensis TaxID=948756 RepID=A0ABY1K1T4_9BACL|nr:peptidase U32 family protein [Paenibacillus macquariensis]MEC0091686.1 U32 family peptidase [Paenibacillus macquariensis]OAB32387.1 peptidase U32 [Paenibacillus macquariensis subsp. macquariensis]SIR14001.1 putative protease [Paenibacillus macquariensis]